MLDGRDERLKFLGLDGILTATCCPNCVGFLTVSYTHLKLETGHMDMIRDSIENRADDVCRAKEELRTTPIYPHSAAYAREHGELEQYRASNLSLIHI